MSQYIRYRDFTQNLLFKVRSDFKFDDISFCVHGMFPKSDIHIFIIDLQEVPKLDIYSLALLLKKVPL